MGRMRLGLALAAVAALALGVLGPASARTQLGTKYGGTLVVGIASDPGTLDPILPASASAVMVFTSICERLYDFDSKLRVAPQLAAALPSISKDKLTYTIPLRRGIVFNDGTPFNAQAVVTTIQRMIMHPKSGRASDFSS